MKAQILKIAGVKNEKEFYKKFPTEAAFMKKHGKQLKKAQVGAMIGASDQAVKPVTPISYSDLYANANSAITGISPEEQARQEELASQQAIAAASSSKGGGIMDMLGQAAPMIAEGLAGAKNGKKLKKAIDGFEGAIKPPTMPKVEMANLANTKGFGLSKLGTAGQSSDRGFDWKGLAGTIGSQLGPIIGSFEQISQENEDIANARKYAQISDITRQAAESRPEQVKRRYVRPEDMLTQTVNPLGVGTNYLAAANGAEIANYYSSPNTIYTDLGYEPLNDSNVKQFKKGGKLPKAESGFDFNALSGVGGGLGGALGSAIGKGSGKGGAASTIASTALGTIGNLLLPGIGGLAGSFLGGLGGGLFDAGRQNELQDAQDKLNENLQASAFQSGAQNVQSRNSGFMEDGGWVSHDWQPQVITKFGEYNVSELLKPPHDADMLRAGGHLKEYTPPTERAMYTGREEFAMGGDLQVGRGKAETMSYNPFLPEGGETVMFRGPSHDDGGMPISYGQNGVEVEGGEPAVVMEDGGQAKNLTVFGAIDIDDTTAEAIGDKKAKGMKFKNYIADLSKVEAKQNKIVDKSTQLINDSDVNDPFDQLSFNSGQASLMGATMKLKDIAAKKANAAAVQNAILETADEYGYKDASKFAKDVKSGKVKKAAFGAKMETAAYGDDLPVTLKPIAEAQPYAFIPGMQPPQIPSVMGTRDNTLGVLQLPKERLNFDMFEGLRASQEGIYPPIAYGKGRELADVKVRPQDEPFDEFTPSVSPRYSAPQAKDKSESWWDEAAMAIGSTLPFLRPSNQMPLDPTQISPEMYAMATNQLEPVQAQLFNPMMQAQPYKVSLQDQRNEVIAQGNAAYRMAQGNPAIASQIAANVSKALTSIGAEENRINQGEVARAAEANRAQFNDAQLKNLSILDQQYARQAEAKSKTKAQNLEALKSIADKTLKNKLENKTLATMENMYNYRFTPSGVAYNLNAPAQFNPYGIGQGTQQLPEGYEYTYRNVNGKLVPDDIKKKAKDKESRNGSIVKAIKNL